VSVVGAFFLCGLMSARVAAQGQPAPLPDGDGKQLVEGLCTACHQTNQITRSSGYTREGWQELIRTMLDVSGNPAGATLTQYLTTHFPAKTHLQPTLVPGEASITFRAWKVPTLGQRARDPVQAPDGSIWWVGQWANVLGRINPDTGDIREYTLPEGAKPHSVTTDKAGNLWYTGNGNGTIGKFDPRTEKVTEYKMPDPAARDPHTAVFDSKGTLWFTLQQSNMVGRLIPATGDIKLVTMPTEKSRPYGIKLSAEGIPWVACNGSNCLVTIDPETMAVQEHRLPDPKTTVRRLDFASDGMLWYVNSSQGRLGRFDPRTAQSKEWPSPSGPKSHPYAIAVVDGIVWYNESGQRPDTLVRFDPATERLHHQAHDADTRGQPADPPEQYKLYHVGDAATRNREAISQQGVLPLWVPVCHVQDGFADKLPVEELARHLANLTPGSFHADGRCELASGNQARQMRQPDGGRLQRQFRKQDEAIQRRPARLPKLSDVTRHFVRCRAAQRDTYPISGQGAQGCRQARPTDRFQDEIVGGVLRKGGDILPDDHVIRADLLDQRDLLGPAHLGDDPGAGPMRELDGKIAYPTGRPGNAHAPLQQQPTLGEGIQGRQARHRERCGLGKGDAVRHRGQGIGRHRDGFGPGTSGQETDHTRPDAWA
jgi:virginiamycin B lyase